MDGKIVAILAALAREPGEGAGEDAERDRALQDGKDVDRETYGDPNKATDDALRALGATADETKIVSP